ncbi:MAG: hypothetical protein LBJ03_00660 [Holosporales bacterium]|jgi:hypothetical protein|nr:hypothetical protein [Holosporales bacterium]
MAGVGVLSKSGVSRNTEAVLAARAGREDSGAACNNTELIAASTANTNRQEIANKTIVQISSKPSNSASYKTTPPPLVR